MKCRKDLAALSFSSLSLVIYNFALEVQVSFVGKKHSYSGWGERLFWIFFPEEHVLNVRDSDSGSRALLCLSGLTPSRTSCFILLSEL